MNDTQAQSLAEALEARSQAGKRLRRLGAKQMSGKALTDKERFQRLSAARLYVRESNRIAFLVAIHQPLHQTVALVGFDDDSER